MKDIILRLPINNYGFIYENLDFKTLNILKTKNNLIKKLNQDNEKISEMLYDEIRKVQDDQTRKYLINFRRKIFKNLKPYTTSIEGFKNEISKQIYTQLKQHNQYRIDLENLESTLQENILLETIIIEKAICSFLDNEWFQMAILSANPKLYQVIFEENSSNLDRNKFTTLLRYLHKSSIMPTPSSLWSGITYATYDEIDNLIIDNNKIKITLDFNSNITKHIAKKNYKKYLNNNNLFYINPTAFQTEDFIYFWSTPYNTLKKCKLPNAYFIPRLYLKLNSLLKMSELIDILKEFIEDGNVYDQICYLIEMDFIKIYGITNYANPNPLKTITPILKEDLSEILDTQYNFYSKNLKNNFKKLLNLDPTFPIQTVRMNLNFQSNSITLNKNVKNSFYEAMDIYLNIFTNLYPINHKNHLKDFIRINYGENTPVSIVELSYKMQHNAFEYKTSNFRSWSKSSNNEKNYNEFINIIRKNIVKGKNIININPAEFKQIFSQNTHSNKLEVIYQFYEEDDKYFIIPEMLSVHIGRLLGRFLNQLNDEEKQTFEKEIYNSIDNKVNLIQGNIHINNDLDGIGFTIPSIKKQAYIYDRNVNADHEPIGINEIYLSLSDNNLIMSLGNNLNETFEIWNASSISPGEDRIYKILNIVSQQNKLNMNGHAFNRIELDLDYQPRICIDNLVISRERFRITKEEVAFLEIYKIPVEEKLIKLFNLLLTKDIPQEFFVYTDSNYKASFVNLMTIYDLYIFQRSIKDCDEYIYIEECLPSKKHYKNKKNMEVWSKYE